MHQIPERGWNSLIFVRSQALTGYSRAPWELSAVLNTFFGLAGASASAKGSVGPGENKDGKVCGELGALHFKSLLELPMRLS